ncbi:MBL fold metallo-hydrolase [Gilvimarinus agarilyticus]|uniref:MBL fold metallo-hydrolase n=1 Tax=Gilvimarinus sp. 2_MG-2023 TaxID=3062666 RepID=UPI001C086114|nr:MBL fold metallo-hydrolase [Gilvimarinus sp. 2_MG-2023]MBU2886700.1 MBL fold metallo-hydrolase [Gilvimarinus agarilyticus]MDO6571367.1 rhodanese-like domain-containing protein [Gilvimarinus sp. 2_MG-2023]
MKLVKIETPQISHYAYMLADGPEAAVIDPSRDIDEYLKAANSVGARIKYVIVTHRQEDFVLGSAHLAEVTGAEIITGDHELFGHGDKRLADGESFTLGDLTIKALHTPGHTPESYSYAVFAPQNPHSAWGVFTGDALFFGTTGRTDLPDADKSIEYAELLYDSVHNKIAELGDTALILPAHGPGSVCGSGMADRSSSTLGDEKQYNDVFTLSRQEFAQKKGSESLPRPPFFRHMEKVNLDGGLAPRVPFSTPLLTAQNIAQRPKDSILLDCRDPEGFAGGHIPNSYSVWLGGMPVFGGWLADHQSTVYLVADRNQDIEQAAAHLSRIGIDGVAGGLAGGFGSWRNTGQPLETSGVVTPQQLNLAGEALQVLDVRELDEYNSGHIPGARHMYVGHLLQHLNELHLHPEKPIVVTCGVGHRAGVAVSILLRAGFKDVRNLLGGMSAWKTLNFPTESGREKFE